MEEATELFALMDTMLQARPARPPPPPRAAEPPPASPAPAVPTGPGGSSDDWLLLGLLALGAGAGLFAATAKRMTAGPPPTEPNAARSTRSPPPR